MKNCYESLPEGYREVFRVNAANKKTAIILNVAALVLTIGLLVVVAVVGGIVFQRMEFDFRVLPYLGLLSVSYIAYIALHELTHGIVYKVMTKRKLTFGFKLTYAFCGVPDVYVSRKTAVLSLCAPLVTYSVLFVLGAVLSAVFGNYHLYFCFGILFAGHFGGCAGDLYDLILYATRLKDGATLMQDSGVEQVFYQK